MISLTITIPNKYKDYLDKIWDGQDVELNLSLQVREMIEKRAESTIKLDKSTLVEDAIKKIR